VWETDPTRWSELISNKVLITKVMDDIPKTTNIKLTKLGGMNTVKNGFSDLTKEKIGQDQ